MSPTYKDAKNIILVLVCTLALVSIGCRGLMDRVTPTDLSPQVSSYLGIEHNDIVSLYEAKQIKDQVIIAHRDIQTALLQYAQGDKVRYEDAITFVQNSIAASEEFQALVVGDESQPFSILGILAGLTGGAAIGRALKRKGDMSPAEVEEVVAKAKVSVINGNADTKS